MGGEPDESGNLFLPELVQDGVDLHCLVDPHLLQAWRTVDEDQIQVIGLERLLTSDVGFRFSIDMASLKSE